MPFPAGWRSTAIKDVMVTILASGERWLIGKMSVISYCRFPDFNSSALSLPRPSFIYGQVKDLYYKNSHLDSMNPAAASWKERYDA